VLALQDHLGRRENPLSPTAPAVFGSGRADLRRDILAAYTHAVKHFTGTPKLADNGGFSVKKG